VDEVLKTLEGEFSDLSDVGSLTRASVRLLVAVLLGAVVGWNRERRGTAAGLRTHMLVALGAALFVLVPLQAGMHIPDMSRVLQGIVTGIGFLGAGAIIKLSEKEQIKGLTTAAGIWATAAIGIAAGMGHQALAVLATVLALVILALLPRLERSRASKTKPEDANTRDPTPNGERGEREEANGRGSRDDDDR
jgi:putative Mg2+ transporter-C (MgtC) family protein